MKLHRYPALLRISVESCYLDDVEDLVLTELTNSQSVGNESLRENV